METTEKLNVKLSNSTEQLLAIKREIDLKSGELEVILEKHRQAGDAFSIQVEETTELREEVDALNKTALDKCIEISKAQSTIAQLELDIKILKDNYQVIKDSLIKDKQSILQEIKDRENECNTLTGEALTLRGEVLILKDKVKQLQSDRKDAQEVFNESIRKSNDQMDIHHKKVAIELSNLAKRRVELDNELIEAEKHVKDELEKIETARQSLSAQELDIHNKDRQLAILLRRAQRMWSKLYPGQDISKLLEQNV